MKLFFICFLLISSITFGQDTIRKVLELPDVTVLKKRKLFKPLSLYDESAAQKYSIKGFDQLEIFDNELFPSNKWIEREFNQASPAVNIIENSKEFNIELINCL